MSRRNAASLLTQQVVERANTLCVSMTADRVLKIREAIDTLLLVAEDDTPDSAQKVLLCNVVKATVENWAWDPSKQVQSAFWTVVAEASEMLVREVPKIVGPILVEVAKGALQGAIARA